MFGLGCIILLFQNAGVDVWEASITKNLPIVCLIIVVPVLSVPIALGGYDQSVLGLTGKFKGNPKLLFMLLSSMFYMFGPITNLGSIHIIHSLVEKLKLPVEFLARVYVRSFASINTWAPYFASVILVITYLEVPLYAFLPYGLLLSLVQFLISNLLFSAKEERSMKIEPIQIQSEQPASKLLQLLFFLILLTGIVFVLERFVEINVSVVIILVALVIALIWRLYLKKFLPFLRETDNFRKSILPKQANEIALFISAGFFAVVLSTTKIPEYLNSLWFLMADVSVLILIFVTIILVSVFAFFGIHQVIVVSSIIATISPELLGLTDITFAMVLLSAWAVAGMISPITPMNVVTSNILNVNVYQIILKWNFLYSVLVAVVHTVVIYIVHLLI